MQVLERPTFDSRESKGIYQYVERHGTTDRETVQNALGLGPETFDPSLEGLTSAGFIEERDGALSLVLDIGTAREYESDDLAYVVRPARDEDFEQLVDLIQDVTAGRTYAVAEELVQELRYEDTVTRHNNVWSRVFFVATVDEFAVGWTHLDLPHVDTLRDTAELTVGVREAYRGYGIGKRLLDRSLAWAQANGYRKLYNSVAATNMNAVTFLEAQGWDREAVREDHFTIDDRLVDEVMMAYTF